MPEGKQKIHVAFLSLGSRGDVQPCIVLAKGLQATGRYRVTIGTHHYYRSWVEEHGVGFHTLPGDPRKVIESAEGQEMLSQGKSMEFLAMLHSAFPAPLNEMEELCEQVDVIVSVTMTADACYCLAEKFDKLYIRMGLMPLRMSRARPTIFALKESLPTRGLNMLSHFVVAGRWWNTPRKLMYNMWRKDVLGLRPIKNKYGMVPLFNGFNIPYVLAVSPAVYPPLDDASANDKVTGFLCWNTDDKKHVPEGLEEWLGKVRL